MRLRDLNSPEVDVWPAFTDFIISVLFVMVIFTFGLFFLNLTQKLVVEDSAYKKMQERQELVRLELTGRVPSVKVPDADGNFQRIVLQVDEQAAGGVLFKKGEANLQADGERTLNLIFDVLEKHKGEYDTVQVEGHTDDEPIHNSRYLSNWELSAARAGAVVNYVLQQRKGFEPWRFSANGRGEYRPYNVKEGELTLSPPGASGRPDYVTRNNRDGKDKLNRRIEIILTYKARP